MDSDLALGGMVEGAPESFSFLLGWKWPQPPLDVKQEPAAGLVALPPGQSLSQVHPSRNHQFVTCVQNISCNGVAKQK